MVIFGTSVDRFFLVLWVIQSLWISHTFVQSSFFNIISFVDQKKEKKKTYILIKKCDNYTYFIPEKMRFSRRDKGREVWPSLSGIKGMHEVLVITLEHSSFFVLPILCWALWNRYFLNNPTDWDTSFWWS